MFNMTYDGTNESQPFILNWDGTPLATFRDRGTATRTLGGVTDEERNHPVHGLSYARIRVEDWTALARRMEPETVTLLEVDLPADDDLVVLGLATTGDVDLEDMPVEELGNFGWACPNCGAVTVGHADDEDDDFLCGCGHDVRELLEDDSQPVPHSPVDSLIYLTRGVNGLIDLAVDGIHGVCTDTITDTEDLPEHLSDAVSMLETAARIIQHEATVHGAYSRRFYDNGVPTSGVRKEPQREPQSDGTTRLVFTDVHFDRYPDGEAFHPLSRDYKETA